MGASDSSSRTPVLDRNVPLPKPSDHLTWRDGLLLIGLVFAGIALIVVAFQFPAVIRFADRLNESFQGMQAGKSPWRVFLIMGIWSSVLVVHELGHLIAARAVGFKVLSLTVGPLTFNFTPRTRLLAFQREMVDGGFVRVLVAGPRLRRRHIRFAGGGLIANIITAGAVGTWLVFNEAGSFVKAVAEQFMLWSSLTVFINTLPFQYGRFHTDGEHLRAMLCSANKARVWLSLQYVTAQVQKGKAPAEWNARWLSRMSSAPPTWMGAFEGRWFAYVRASALEEVDTAAALLDQCLALSSRVERDTRAQLMLEAAVFQAWYRSDAKKAREWMTDFSKVARAKTDTIRADISIACAEGDFVTAQELVRNTIGHLTSEAETSAQRRLRDAWLKWSSEIEARANAQTSTAPANGASV